VAVDEEGEGTRRRGVSEKQASPVSASDAVPTSATSSTSADSPVTVVASTGGIAMKQAAVILLVLLAAGWSVGGLPVAVLLPFIAALAASFFGLKLHN
jgi:hypothetical protein